MPHSAWNNRYSWSRTDSRALKHQGPDQSFELYATVGGFSLLGLSSGDVWFLPTDNESYALELADPFIYPEG